MTRQGLETHRPLLAGLVAGALAGVAVHATLGVGHPVVDAANYYVAGPVGQIFLRLLLMVVVPLVFASVSLGVAGLGESHRALRVSGKAAAFFVSTTFLASALGVLIAWAARPGGRIAPDTRSELMATFAADASSSVDAASTTRFGIETIVNAVPRNPIRAAVDLDLLGVMFFAIIFGAALSAMPGRRGAAMRAWLESLNDIAVTIVTMILRVAPFGVACLLFGVTSRFGNEVLTLLGWFVATVLAALLAHVLITLSAVIRFGVGIPATSFYSRTREALITAFSTSSSSAALPTALAAAELNLGIPPRVAGFVLPLGSTMCMNGTALFQAAAVVTLAQAFGVALAPGALVALSAVCVVTSIGAAGVPGGSIPLLIGALRLFDVPVEGIALVIGVDRLLDMARTTVNAASALVATAFVARSEGEWTPGMLPDSIDRITEPAGVPVDA